MLVLTQSFLGREDPGLTDRLLAEAPGIFNWAIEGLDRLNERGYFEPPESGKDAVQQLEDLSSPVSAFVRDRCNIGHALGVNVDELFAAWGRWCDGNGNQQGSKGIFGKNLKAAFPQVTIAQHKQSDGTRPRYYTGINLDRG